MAKQEESSPVLFLVLLPRTVTEKIQAIRKSSTAKITNKPASKSDKHNVDFKQGRQKNGLWSDLKGASLDPILFANQSPKIEEGDERSSGVAGICISTSRRWSIFTRQKYSGREKTGRRSSSLSK